MRAISFGACVTYDWDPDEQRIVAHKTYRERPCRGEKLDGRR